MFNNDIEALKYLENLGWGLTSDYNFVPPSQEHIPSSLECSICLFLMTNYGFGWIIYGEDSV